MANNRIYLRCKGCGATLFLGKTFLQGYYFDRYGGPQLEDRLNEFYDTHNYCDCPKAESKPYDTELFPLPVGFEGSDGAFDIVYENDEGIGPVGWVNIKEGLPIVGETVVIVDKFGRKDLATYTKDGKWQLPYGILDGWVSAWFRVPEPPRREHD